MEYFIILNLQAVCSEGFDHVPSEDVGCIDVFYDKDFAEREMLRLQQKRKGSELYLFRAISKTNPTHIFCGGKQIFRVDLLKTEQRD